VSPEGEDAWLSGVDGVVLDKISAPARGS